MSIGVPACAAMVLIGEGDIMLASVLFFIGNIGVSGSLVFYDSLLPHVAKPRKPIACRRPATRWAMSAAACCC